MRTKLLVLGLVSLGGVVGTVLFAEAEEKVFSHSVDCRKNSTGGCSQTTSDCTTDIPSDYVITSDLSELNANMTWVLSSNGPKGTKCTPTLSKLVDVQATTAGGKKITVKQPHELCLAAHVESGAGPGHLGDSFKLTCTTKFEIQEIEP